MLSTTAEYALRIMVVLAKSQDRPTTSERIASLTGVPADYAVKVLQMLARAKLVRAQRGRGGGFRLDAEPGSTSLLDVVNAVEPLERGSGGEHPGSDAEPSLLVLHDLVESAMERLRGSLAQTTLSAVLEQAEPPLEAVVTPSGQRLPAGSHAAGVRQ